MRFRKKPVEIDAVRWEGMNADAVLDFMGTDFETEILDSGGIAIRTLEGTMTADVGDWIIRGVAGELYPCKPDIFDATYEAVEEGSPAA